MVYAVAFVAVSQAEWLKELHVAGKILHFFFARMVIYVMQNCAPSSDSKVLTEAKRDEIYYGSFLQPENRALFGWEAISLSPAEISAKMLQRYVRLFCGCRAILKPILFGCLVAACVSQSEAQSQFVVARYGDCPDQPRCCGWLSHRKRFRRYRRRSCEVRRQNTHCLSRNRFGRRHDESRL